MDNSNLAGQNYSQAHCRHGRGIDHEPEGESVGERQIVPNPSVLGIKTYWTERCCGKPMLRYKEVQTQRCKKCGRTNAPTTSTNLALCACCASKIDKTSYPDYNDYDG